MPSRLFLLRHGETPWTLTGQHTGLTDLALTAHGESQVSSTATQLVGKEKLVDPAYLVKVFVSPLVRARRTCDLFLGLDGKDSEDENGLEKAEGMGDDVQGRVSIEPALSEWDYGDVEGLTPKEAGELWRKRRQGGESEGSAWDIWRDGCEGGESPEQVQQRMGALIAKITEVQGPLLREGKRGDVLLVAHGHILRAFVKRWLGMDMTFPLQMELEPGGLGMLGYKHGNVQDRMVYIGMALPIASGV